MQVLIAANGDNARWGHPGPKVLAEVDGEPLLHRTLRLVPDAIALSHRSDVLSAVCPRGHEVPQTGSVCETVLAARGWWAYQPFVLLLGDVWYGADCLADALAYRGRLVRAWGSEQEVYAVACGEQSGHVVVGALEAALHFGGKLWHLLRVLDGLDPSSHAVLPSMLTFVGDGTRDFDTRGEFRRWARGRAQSAAAALRS